MTNEELFEKLFTDEEWNYLSHLDYNEIGEKVFNKTCEIKDKEIKSLKQELNQQKFNNQHNLSIDQKISNEIESLKQELKTEREKVALLHREIDEINDKYLELKATN